MLRFPLRSRRLEAWWKCDLFALHDANGLTVEKLFTPLCADFRKAQVSRRMAERRFRKSVQSFSGWYTTIDTSAAHEPSLFADSHKTLARLKARDTAVIDVQEKT